MLSRPTSLLKKCKESIIHPLTQIINKLLQIGSFSMLMEKTVITPLLKKPNLKLEYKNYHPISNLPFISKLAEKSALLQINPFLNSTDTYSRNNTGYKPFHSTETILLKIHDDIIKTTDNRNIVLLYL